jgi:hypothetical protein
VFGLVPYRRPDAQDARSRAARAHRPDSGGRPGAARPRCDGVPDGRHDGLNPEHFLLAKFGDRDAWHVGLLDQQRRRQPLRDFRHGRRLRHRSADAEPIEPRALLDPRVISLPLRDPRDADARHGRRFEHTTTTAASSTPAASGSASTTATRRAAAPASSAAGRASTATAGRPATTATSRASRGGSGLPCPEPARADAAQGPADAGDQALPPRQGQPGHLQGEAQGTGGLTATQAGKPARSERTRERRARPRPSPLANRARPTSLPPPSPARGCRSWRRPPGRRRTPRARRSGGGSSWPRSRPRG